MFGKRKGKNDVKIRSKEKDANKKKIFAYIMLGLVFVFGLVQLQGFLDEQVIPQVKGQIDDWQFDSETNYAGSNSKFASIVQKAGRMVTQSVGVTEMNSLVGSPSMAMDASSKVGFSTGGAKDINNFRENIKNNYLPLPSDVTYEGLFYDYYFDLESDNYKKCEEMFCPAYTKAVSKDPFSEEEEYFLSVGLDSGIEDFKREKLNLVIVLDISGSMGSPFNQYYYDGYGNKVENEDLEIIRKSKMEVATESIAALLSHLDDDDYFGMVVYDTTGVVAKPLFRVGDTNMNEIKNHILELQPRGGTNMESGYKLGTSLYKNLETFNEQGYENRIIFLTDAMPNTGNIDENSLLGMTKENSKNKIYSTFIGIGVDFNSELIEHITKVQGANYYSVHNSKDFETRMDDEFEFMVTPLVFDLNLELEADGWEIEKVYGSPEASVATGTIMKVNTLFPSAKTDEGVKGGMVLLQLKKLSGYEKGDEDLKLKVSYQDREGNFYDNEKEIEFGIDGGYSEDSFENPGIRKGILLSRHANLLKNWMQDERTTPVVVEPRVNHEEGIPVPYEYDDSDDVNGWQLSKWERKSMPLTVSSDYNKLFSEFSSYFDEEMNKIDDSSLEKESEILQKLSRI